MLNKIQKENNEVIYLQDSTFTIDDNEIQRLIKLSKKNKKKIIRLCLHKNVNSDVHQMIIVHPKNYYIRPHKVLDKSETGMILKGNCDLILFEDDGVVKEKISMGPISQKNKPFIYNFPKNTYHTLLIKSDLVFLEIIKGPFRRSKVKFAEWAPINYKNKFEVNNFLKNFNLL